eukprot:PhM_4_TR11700/c0_g1_i4/m.85893
MQTKKAVVNFYDLNGKQATFRRFPHIPELTILNWTKWIVKAHILGANTLQREQKRLRSCPKYGALFQRVMTIFKAVRDGLQPATPFYIRMTCNALSDDFAALPIKAQY